MKLPATTFSFLFYFIRKQWLKFSAFTLFSIIFALNEAFFPFFIKKIVNVLQNHHGPRGDVYVELSGILILLLLFWLVMTLTQRAQNIIQIYTFPKFRAHMRKALFDYIKGHSHEFFSNQPAGNISKKIADVPDSSQIILEITFFSIITASVGLVLTLVMMWWIKATFALILLGWVLLHFLFMGIFLRYGNYLWEVHADAVANLSGKIADVLANISNVRLFSRGSYESHYLQKFQEEEIKKSKKAMWISELTQMALGFNALLLIAAMIFTLVYGWVHYWVTLGDFTQIGMQSFWMLSWVWFISFQLTIYAREWGSISAALVLIRTPHGLVDIPQAKLLVIERGHIQFRQVDFYYQKNQPVFRKLTVDIPAGQKVGLVGFSGSGKSTFVNLILRFYDIKSGKILIDQQSIAEVKQESLRAQIAMIPQEPSLFHRSLMENIRYGRLNASDEEVIIAAKLAHCHEFIEKIDGGYHALVGERGIKLSGGQRQRIAIARAILKNAPILILDEATSALDSATEQLIQESLQQLMQNRTTLVVAHRLSTLANMDRILVFDNGKIVEEGTQEELLEKNGHFALLWYKQTGDFLPEKE